MKVTVHNEKGDHQYEFETVDSAIEFIDELIQKAFNETGEDKITVQVIEDD